MWDMDLTCCFCCLPSHTSSHPHSCVHLPMCMPHPCTSAILSPEYPILVEHLTPLFLHSQGPCPRVSWHSPGQTREENPQPCYLCQYNIITGGLPVQPLCTITSWGASVQSTVPATSPGLDSRTLGPEPQQALWWCQGSPDLRMCLPAPAHQPSKQSPKYSSVVERGHLTLHM